MFFEGVCVLAVVKGDLWGLLSGNQGLKREIDKPSTNPKKDKIHTYYIMPSHFLEIFLYISSRAVNNNQP
ncbi:MAG: hypothetical protein ACTSRV_08015 [Candidatus Freyarchaeota archaeon]